MFSWIPIYVLYYIYTYIYIYVYKYPFVVGHIFPLPVNPSAFPCLRRPSDTHVALEMLKDGGYSCGFVWNDGNPWESIVIGGTKFLGKERICRDIIYI
jgi:hypothetical protein